MAADLAAESIGEEAEVGVEPEPAPESYISAAPEAYITPEQPAATAVEEAAAAPAAPSLQRAEEIAPMEDFIVENTPVAEPGRYEPTPRTAAQTRPK